LVSFFSAKIIKVVARLRWGSLQSSLDPLAGFWRPISKGREERRPTSKARRRE